MYLPPAVFRRRRYGVRFSLARAQDGVSASPAPADYLRVRYAPSLPDPDGPALWERVVGQSDPPAFHGLYGVDGGFRLKVRCQGSGSFVFKGDELLIAWEPGGTGPAYYLFGLGLALWLETRGVPCLHANALAAGDHGFGLVGDSKTGKTTLTLALLQRGVSLVSDDLLTLAERGGRFWARPGLPQMRIWPDTITDLLPTAEVQGLERVHPRLEKRWVPTEPIFPGAFARTAKAVRTLYLLERDTSGDLHEVVLETVPPSEALLKLLTYSVIGGAATALGVEVQRLGRLARVAATVRVRRLRYPDGLEWLPEVCEAIAADLQARSIRTSCSAVPVPYR
ncbi:MAG TPA: hypothetical protein VL086_22170 [Candidatus Nitrosotalea sp.]|nr:hypothetical protein [Candidatus Nitrosotalea sp.]